LVSASSNSLIFYKGDGKGNFHPWWYHFNQLPILICYWNTFSNYDDFCYFWGWFPQLLIVLQKPHNLSLLIARVKYNLLNFASVTLRWNESLLVNYIFVFTIQ
jgi:hypothetical protein